METAAEPRSDDPAPASRASADEDPAPTREHRADAAIQAHHFQRPTVSPVGLGDRSVPRGG